MTSLYNLRPTSEDLQTIRDFPEVERPTLGKVEKFFLEIMDIPRYDQRLECFIFKLKFGARVEELRASLKVVKSATNQVAQSKLLSRILEVVLKLGNVLNGGTGRGGSYGFKLDGLNKLATIKSVDNKSTLMNYLASWCSRNEPELLAVDDDLNTVAIARRHPLTGWQADFKALTKSVELIDEQLKLATTEEDEGKAKSLDDKFIDVMEPFFESASRKVKSLDNEFERVKGTFEKVVVSFGEDPSTSGCEEFFGQLLTEFLFNFRKAQHQNNKRQMIEEKARKKAEAARKKDEAREARRAAQREADMLADTFFPGGGAEQTGDDKEKLADDG